MTYENEFQASGSSPSADFTIRNEGSMLLLTPHTEPACNWIDQHIGPDNVIEPRYVIAILEGIRVGGLEIES